MSGGGGGAVRASERPPPRAPETGQTGAPRELRPQSRRAASGATRQRDSESAGQAAASPGAPPAGPGPSSGLASPIRMTPTLSQSRSRIRVTASEVVAANAGYAGSAALPTVMAAIGRRRRESRSA